MSTDDGDADQLDSDDLHTPRQAIVAQRRLNPFFARIEFLVLVLVVGTLAGIFVVAPALHRRDGEQIRTHATPSPPPLGASQVVPVGNTLLSASPPAHPGPTPPVPGNAPLPPASTPAETALAQDFSGNAKALPSHGGPLALPPSNLGTILTHPTLPSVPAIPPLSVPNPTGEGLPTLGTAPLPASTPLTVPLPGEPAESDVMISGGTAPSGPQPALTPTAARIVSETADSSLVAGRMAFTGSAGAAAGYSGNRLSDPISQHEIFAGTPVRLQLDDAIDTSLPGSITAHTLYDTHCSLPPYPVCIPRATTVQGRYNAAVQSGEGRVEIAWDVMTFPNGDTFDLGGMPGADVTGADGLPAQVDNHTGHLFTTTLLTGILAAGAQLAQPANSSLLTAPSVGQQVAGALGGAVAATGNQLIVSHIQRPPTLTIARGREFIVRLRSTLVIDPSHPQRPS